MGVSAIVWNLYKNNVHFSANVVDSSGKPIEDYTLLLGNNKEGLSASLSGLWSHFLTPKKQHWFKVTVPGYIDSIGTFEGQASDDIVRAVKLYPKSELPVPEMVRIERDKFEMGDSKGDPDEQSVRSVTFSGDFEIGKYEVAFEEYDMFAHTTERALPADGGWSRSTRPVINVSWDDAVAYAKWLTQQTGEEYRLPSEAEWEYAARADKTTNKPSNYWWGDEIGTNNANCYGCGSKWDGEQTAPVASLKENPFGLYDTAGNVWEWVQDCYADSYEGAPKDGTAVEAADCSERVWRGGSWNNEPHNLRSANRNRNRPDNRNNNNGFRLASPPACCQGLP